MNGVEILTSEEVVVESVFNWNAWLVTLVLVFAVYIVFGVFLGVKMGKWSYLLTCAVVGVVAGALIGCISGSGIPTPTKYKTQYKVTVSDDVQMNEFNEKYEIIEQDGKIYTVRERD